MTDAAILATFADWRTVKGRKVLQLVFEVPLEDQAKVLSHLGPPMPMADIWCGIAKIEREKERSERVVQATDGLGNVREYNISPGNAQSIGLKPVARKGKAGDGRKEARLGPAQKGDDPTMPENSSEGYSEAGCAGSIPVMSQASPATKSPRKWADMPPSSRAALLCKEPEFWQWLNVTDGDVNVFDEASATADLKQRLFISSRAEIVEGSRAAAELSRMIGNYNAYRQAKGHGVS